MDFVIFSMGRTATQWLKAALNEHPDIRCFHGPEPFKQVDPLDWDRYFDDVHKLDWIGYLASGSYWSRIGKDAKNFGNVHGLNPSRWANDPTSYKNTYRCIQITREPRARIASMLARWDTDAKLEPETFARYRQQGAEFLTSVGIPIEHDSLFPFACLQVFRNETDFLRRDIPIYRMEDLFEAETFARMTRQLCDAEWRSADIERALALSPVDARNPPPLTEDQLNYADRLITHFGLGPIYRSLGYL